MKGTLAETTMHQQASAIYDILSKYGYPGIIDRALPHSAQEAFAQLNDYFQPTPQRTHLLEWLISQLDPTYQHQGESIQNDSGVVKALWRLGVMPYSKHTRNLDYEKYVSGLLGQQKAVSVVHQLCNLLQEVSRGHKAKEDKVFTDFFSQAIKNYNTLVETDHDPYQISFPPSYSHLSPEQFNEQWLKCEEKVCQIEEMRQARQEGSNWKDIFGCFQRNKAQFKEKYATLVEKIESTVASNKHIVALGKQQQQNSPDARTLQISPSLSVKYAAYRKKIALQRPEPSTLPTKRKELQSALSRLNDQVPL